MHTLITNPSELRRRGFQVLAEGLGWVNAVRFLGQFEAGTSNYTEERRTLLPDWDTETLLREAAKLNPPRPDFAGTSWVPYTKKGHLPGRKSADTGGGVRCEVVHRCDDARRAASSYSETSSRIFRYSASPR